jgi:hypothetical protein
MVQMQEAIQYISFNSDDRRVAVVFHDGTRLEYELPIPNRSGVRNRNRNDNQGLIKNHRALADAGHISPGRMSQILNLTYLAPSIQEQLLFLPQTKSGSDLVKERDLRAIAQVVDWDQQKGLLQQVMEGGEVR